MSGNRNGGLKAAATNKARYGETFYQRIGRVGGTTSYGRKRGFASNPELARRAGKIGGSTSRRGKGSVVKTKIEPIANEIIAEYTSGTPLTAIAKRHGLSYNTLKTWVKDNAQIKLRGDK